MQDLEDAQEELKRVDHLIYVSLKYTRTVDVLLNIISRMIDAYGFLLDALLKLALKQGRIDEIPSSPIERGNLVKQVYDDQNVHDNVELYFLLRKLFRSNPVREHEYRRNVAMKTFIEGREEIVNIDIITNYYNFMLAFLKQVAELVKDFKDLDDSKKEVEEDDE